MSGSLARMITLLTTRRCREGGWSVARIAESARCSPSTVHRRLKAAGYKPKPARDHQPIDRAGASK